MPNPKLIAMVRNIDLMKKGLRLFFISLAPQKDFMSEKHRPDEEGIATSIFLPYHVGILLL